MKRVRLDSPRSRSATEVLASLNVSFAAGLSDHEAEQRLSVYGANAIGSRQKVGLISVLVHQFQSLVVVLLAVAAAVALYFQEWEECGAIVGVLILNTAIGFVTEIKAARSIEAIRAYIVILRPLSGRCLNLRVAQQT
jgi:Ca2+-transporting ATPase